MNNNIFFKSIALMLICLASSALYSVSTKLTVTNETHKTLILYFDSMIYKKPQRELLLPKQTRSIFLEDYTDVDITKDITIEARGASPNSVTWSFAQTDLRDNMTLIFSKNGNNALKLTIIKRNGATRIVDPISRQ